MNPRDCYNDNEVSNDGVVINDDSPDLYEEPEFCHNHKELNFVSNGGLDTMYLSLKVKWCKQHEKIRKTIDKIKGKAAIVKKDDEFLPILEINGHQLEIAAHGTNTGNSRFSYFPYKMKENGIGYLLSERDLEQCTASNNVNIHIGSLPLMKWGEEFCFNMAIDTIKVLGGKIKECQLSRIDPCVDIAGMDIAALQDAITEDRYVCRARHIAEYVIDYNEDSEEEKEFYRSGHRKTGFALGKSGIRARGYEKIIETRHNEEKRCILIGNRFDGEEPEKAVRLEFQIRTEALRNLKTMDSDNPEKVKCDSIKTFEDYKKCKGELLDYLVNHWLRLYSKSFDRRHTERLTDDDLLPEWKTIIAEFKKLADGNGKLVHNTEKEKIPENDALKKQAVGCILSVLSKSLKSYEAIEELVIDACAIIAETIENYNIADLTRNLKRKILRVKANCVTQCSPRIILESCGCGVTGQHSREAYDRAYSEMFTPF